MGKVSAGLRFEVLKRDSFKCQYCGASAPEVLLEVDHIEPGGQGGSSDIWNLVSSCRSCNRGKSDKRLSDDTAIARAKAQLDELQERREQLSMLLEWKSGLAAFELEAALGLSEYWAELILDRDYRPGREDLQILRKLVSDYSSEEVATAMAAATRYFDNEISEGSRAVAFNKIGAICAVKRKTEGQPHLHDAYRIRLLARRRCVGKYFNDGHALGLICEALKAGNSPDRVANTVHDAHCWGDFRTAMESLCDQQEVVPAQVCNIVTDLIIANWRYLQEKAAKELPGGGYPSVRAEVESMFRLAKRVVDGEHPIERPGGAWEASAPPEDRVAAPFRPSVAQCGAGGADHG